MLMPSNSGLSWEEKVRICNKKKAHLTYVQAYAAVAKVRKRSSEPDVCLLAVFRCEVCGFFHTGRARREVEVKELTEYRQRVESISASAPKPVKREKGQKKGRQPISKSIDTPDKLAKAERHRLHQERLHREAVVRDFERKERHLQLMMTEKEYRLQLRVLENEGGICIGNV